MARAPERAVSEVDPMVEFSRQPPRDGSRDEHAFWDASLPPRRERRRSRAEESGLGRLPERLRDRLTDWRHDARFGVVVLLVIAVTAGVIWYRVGINGASAGESGAPAAATTAAPRTTLADPTPARGASTRDATNARPAKIAVHVAGAVTHPGVVELDAGARVIDAVEAVGGALADGDLDRLNLAAKVADGQRVYVAKVGQPDPGVIGGGAATSGPDAPVSGGTSDKLNLNTATAAQLEALPGIGPTYAEAIVAERQRRGGFTSVNDLRSVRGIGEKRFAELAPLVTV